MGGDGDVSEMDTTAEVKDEGYRVWVEADAGTVHFEGSMRLSTRDYQPISALLEEVAGSGVTALTLDLRALEFLNSSGINTLYKFIVGLRKRGGIGLRVLGSRELDWQTRSLANITRFMADAELQLD